MKILHVIDHLGLGGAQTVLGEFLRCWPEPNDAIHVVALGKRTELVEPFRSIPNVRVSVYGSSKWGLVAVRRLRREIKTGAYDVVHAHLTKATCAVLASVGNSNSRCVVHLHNDPQEVDKWLRWAIRRWSQRVDLLVPCSQQTADSAGECFPELRDRTHVVYNGIDFERLDAVPPYKDLRADLGFAVGDVLLGFAGRLVEQKGVTYLLKAMPQIVTHRPNVRLLIIGDGPLRSALEQEASALSLSQHVRFVGFRADVGSWMQQLDVGVLPSLHEGTSLTLIEMMGYGLPMVATRVSGTPEVIRHEQSGLLVDARDVGGLAVATRQYVDDLNLRGRHGRTARADVRDRFSAQRISSQLRSLYQTILSQQDFRRSIFSEKCEVVS